jgi:microcystin-dependent protein
MSQPYVGQILMFAGNFPPAGWMMCQGRIIPISENDTLFNLIGTTYGGDGQSTFGLPDLQGRVPVHMGTGGGLSPYFIGQAGGSESVTLTTQQIPQHNHNALTFSGAPGGNSDRVTNSTFFADQAATVPGGGTVYCYGTGGGSQQPMSPAIVGNAGQTQPHENIQPILTVTYIISLFGVYPTPT